jgi:hypothetical protein
VRTSPKTKNSDNGRVHSKEKGISHIEDSRTVKARRSKKTSLSDDSELNFSE